MSNIEPVFSNYELRQFGLKLRNSSDTMTIAECVGSFADEMETKVITKMCRGVPTKTRVHGTGSGNLTISLHMPVAMYKKIYAMERDDLAEGVMGYGRSNVHPEFGVVADVYDEDGNEKLVAYPNCICQTGPNSEIENGAEEVAEVELEVSVMPDEHGYGKYEAMVDGLDTEIQSAWMTNFTPELVQKVPTI